MSFPQPAPLTRYQRIYQVVQQVPYGKVATYGQIAELAGLFGQARQVGWALYRLAPSSEVPWHRVVNAKGQVSRSIFRNGADEVQRELLEREGIPFSETGQIDLQADLWHPARLDLEHLDAARCEGLRHRGDHLPAG